LKLKFRLKWSKSVTLPNFNGTTNLELETAIGGQFAWGGTPQKRYLWGLKISSSRSEI